MAKWGKGDPRWIVEERPDATNVNNWHWTEKNASSWSKEKITELLSNLIVEGDVGTCWISKVRKIEGDASATNRKAKLFFFYEWTLTLDWVGSATGGTEEVKGKVEIPNLSEENEPSEIDVTVTCKSSSQDGDRLKEMMRKKGAEKIREQLAQYIRDLREEFSKGMILPKKGAENGENNETQPRNLAPTVSSSTSSVSNSSDTTAKSMKSLDIGGTRIATSKLTLKTTFKCTAEEIYNALTVKEMVQAFTRGTCKMDAVKGGVFELFSGNVSGEFIDLSPYKKLSMRWRFSGWPDAHFSRADLTINQKEDNTEVTLVQTGVPTNDLDRTKQGWNTYYWESMKKTFGFGAMLF